MSNYKTVFFTLGILLIILGVAMIVPVAFQLIYNEFDSTFIISGIITITFGILFFLSNIDHLKSINTHQAFLLTALSWLSIAIFGSLPFFFSQLNLSITDSFFESMSGITTTGATILSNIEDTPKGILIWRAFLQWLGGIGIVVIALFILPFLRIGGMQLFHLEGDDPYDKSLPKISSVVKRIFIIYATLTVTLIFLYYICGMMPFDAISHSFTTISTGGFSTYDSSFAFFNNDKILLVAIIFMILGSLPFLVLVQTSKKKIYLLFLKTNKLEFLY